MRLKRILVAVLLVVILLAGGAFGMMMIRSNQMKARDFTAVGPAGLSESLFEGDSGHRAS